ncbi:hypothetical protein POX_c03790 [Penicillium oxalicum]|uniref:COX assembly mitochondrial protein n=1 Tax=Penicillium oxalicum (strain 114-2 / CGMCC 5302) TaxID=933388 RepID=S7Z9Q8_PENO1|nr:hypothetical protein POX_c03790 [Penicillium oxalicum]EPS25396.1 hypothetical protein PDE_00329 [Penicillium oxalicum 114-2]KAI2790938.1 hypothetical protein POX_c03790 [Penicillium oxalicum]
MASTSESSDPSATIPVTKKYNFRNPLPLSASQEQEVKQLYYKRVRARCAPEIKAFAECAVNRTVTATWVCRQQRLAMNACMVTHANNREEEDRAREEWFATYEERRRVKEEELKRVEQRRAEVITMMRQDEERRRQQQQSEGK